MPPFFDLQGHRGARGLKPENTLPSFEVAFDLGVSTVETDLHLTRDGVPLIVHDAAVSGRLSRRLPHAAVPEPSDQLLISSLTREECRGYAADRNPDPARFPGQDAAVMPLAALFGQQEGLDPYTLPSLAELFRFVTAYVGELGQQAGKSAAQQARARQVHFDLELKRVPFFPEAIGDHFDGQTPGLLEQRVVEVVRAADMVRRTTVRSFDHRAVRAVRRLEPGLTGAVLIEGTAPCSPGDLARLADASIYCPGLAFVDEALVREAHAAGVRVIPWTANRPEEWEQLLAWDVDGITTDFPDQLTVFLKKHGIQFERM
jgi:glycerophosphoryl diester phosphodiesterase